MKAFFGSIVRIQIVWRSEKKTLKLDIENFESFDILLVGRNLKC